MELPDEPVVLRLHDKFPNLIGYTQDTDDFDLYKYLGNSWGLILMHPGDFTPVCTTELGEAAKRAPAFADRNVKLCGFSCNNALSHQSWIKDIEVATRGKVKFPIYCDSDRQVSTSFGFLDPENYGDDELPLTVRSVYIVNPAKSIELIMSYPASVGRSFDELFRILESLQRSYKRGGVATPADWYPGQDVLVDFSLTNAQADEKFGPPPSGYKVIEVPSEQGRENELKKNYLRKTADELL